MKFSELSDVLPIYEEIKYEILGTDIAGIVKVSNIGESRYANHHVMAISFKEGLITLKDITYNLLIKNSNNIYDETINYNLKELTQKDLIDVILNTIKNNFTSDTLSFTINKNY